VQNCLHTAHCIRGIVDFMQPLKKDNLMRPEEGVCRQVILLCIYTHTHMPTTQTNKHKKYF